MAKKKRRYRNCKPSDRPQARDTHHLCFVKKNWSYGYIKTLRQFHYCRMNIPRDTLHRCIHENMKGVPAPSNFAAKLAYEQLVIMEKSGALHDNDPIEKRLSILAALFDCIEQPTADAFRKQLNITQKYKLSLQ